MPTKTRAYLCDFRIDVETGENVEAITYILGLDTIGQRGVSIAPDGRAKLTIQAVSDELHEIIMQVDGARSVPV